MRYTVRPISDRTWLGSMGKESTRFSAKWSDTLALLGREVDYLKGRDVVIEIDVREQDLKLNGELRSKASPSSSAVAIAFESKHGPLFYRCDRFFTSYYHQGPAWQHNVRAIALTIEALRSVSRWGAVETGQQYQGFKAIGGPSPVEVFNTVAEAEAWLRDPDVCGFEGAAGLSLGRLTKHVARLYHPDTGGDPAMWAKYDKAVQMLRAAGRV